MSILVNVTYTFIEFIIVQYTDRYVFNCSNKIMINYYEIWRMKTKYIGRTCAAVFVIVAGKCIAQLIVRFRTLVLILMIPRPLTCDAIKKLT